DRSTHRCRKRCDRGTGRAPFSRTGTSALHCPLVVNKMEKLLNSLLFDRVTAALLTLGDMTLLFWETVQSFFKRRLNFGDLTYQLYFIGLKSQSVVLITGAFTGMVLAAQTYLQFHKVRMDTATMAVVSVSMLSQLGPVLTGLMVAGRVGASIAAEL